MDNIAETIKMLKIGYLKKLESEIEILNNIVNSEITMENALEALAKIHKIAGTSGMYGLDKLSLQAQDMEVYLLSVKNNEIPLSENDIRDRIRGIVKCIGDIIKEG